jgi:hypothetical protein
MEHTFRLQMQDPTLRMKCFHAKEAFYTCIRNPQGVFKNNVDGTPKSDVTRMIESRRYSSTIASMTKVEDVEKQVMLDCDSLFRTYIDTCPENWRQFFDGQHKRELVRDAKNTEEIAQKSHSVRPTRGWKTFTSDSS